MNKILITGKTGTVGSNLHFGIGFPSSDYDLKDKRQTEELFEHVNPDAVVHCAASVGGLGFHLEQKYKLFYENLIMGLNVINCAKERKTKRVLSFLSACVFSEKCPQPVDESQVHEHEPFFVHYPYGLAKRMLDIQSRICYEQFGLIYNCVIPTNIYGINDNFNIHNGHVLASLIHKAYLASKNNTEFVVWGDGEQERNFLFTDDIAKLTEWVLNNYTDKEPLIFSNSYPVKIKYAANIIADKFNVKEKLIFDTKGPTGQASRSLNGDKLIKLTNFKFTSIEEGINKTIDWFLENYPNVRL